MLVLCFRRSKSIGQKLTFEQYWTLTVFKSLSSYISSSDRLTRRNALCFYHAGSTLQATQETRSKPQRSEDEESGSEVSESEDEKPAATSKQVPLRQVEQRHTSIICKCIGRPKNI